MTEETAGGSPFEAFWQDLLDDTEATAAEYEDEGWDVHTVTPGDVTALADSDKPFGIRVLIPDPEFEEIESRAAENIFDSVDVYKKTVSSVVFLLVVERDPTTETAILIPAYYNVDTDGELLETARSEGKMPLHLRALGADNEVTFVHEDHSLFAPDREEENSG